MIKKLRHRFILIIMAMLIVLYITILVSINVASLESGKQMQEQRMEQIAENDGILGKFDLFQEDNSPPGERKFDTPTPSSHLSRQDFSIKIDQNGNIFELIPNVTPLYTEDEITQLLDYALQQGNPQGTVGNFSYLIAEKNYGKIVVFSNQASENTFNSRLFWISLIVGGVSLIIMFFVALWISKIVIKPIQTTFEKQKQFISDASHELKTPLTVIRTNADVLKQEIGDNKWLGFIQSESLRMSGLVNDLLSLARIDNASEHTLLQDFNLSMAVSKIVLPFESIVYEQDKQFYWDIEPNLTLNGVESQLQQLVSILLDNAIKNTPKKGEVRLTLLKDKGKKKLTVYNTGMGIKPENYSLIWERFYREDTVRNSQSGSYGLGLSIAKEIVNKHKGEIYIEGVYGKFVQFVVYL